MYALKPCLTVLLSVALLHCASPTPKQPPPEPIAKTVTLKGTTSAQNPMAKPVKKNLFHITVSPKGYSVNGVEVKSVIKLEELLRAHNKPVITITIHRCTNSEDAKAIMNLAQKFTDTPIPYSAYGSYSDDTCLQSNE